MSGSSLWTSSCLHVMDKENELYQTLSGSGFALCGGEVELGTMLCVQLSEHHILTVGVWPALL